MNRHRTWLALTMAALCVGLLVWNNDRPQHYYHHSGEVFGTLYNIRYQAHANLSDSIRQCLKQVDDALSMFNQNSDLSRINRNEPVTVSTDFLRVFTEAQSVSDLSGGAFDMTVAPLVNAWGFGFENKAQMTAERVDSLRALIGYRRIHLQGRQIVKDHPAIRLDAGAIAKGFACDKVAEMLRRQGCTNLLVDIGGEVVARGKNSKGELWTIGLTKPIDDPTGTRQELQATLRYDSVCMATSGNYRNFYYEGTERRSHTIDPRTGYPVQHNLLSATVTASSCMRADALATACMVLGAEEAVRMIDQTDDAACCLIVGENDKQVFVLSKRWTHIEELIK